MQRSFLLGAVLIFASAACGDDADGSDDDAAQGDASARDAGRDASAEGGLDASRDAATDAASSDAAPVDAGADSGMDAAGSDASSGDAGSDAAADSGSAVETDAAESDTGTAAGDAGGAESFAAIWADIIMPKCAGCHKAGVGGVNFGKLDLSSPTTAYAQLLDQTAKGSGCANSGMKLVVAGNADASLLVHKVVEPDDQVCGIPMPEEAAPLDAASIVRIRRWIDQGAANN